MGHCEPRKLYSNGLLAFESCTSHIVSCTFEKSLKRLKYPNTSLRLTVALTPATTTTSSSTSCHLFHPPTTTTTLFSTTSTPTPSSRHRQRPCCQNHFCPIHLFLACLVRIQRMITISINYVDNPCIACFIRRIWVNLFISTWALIREKLKNKKRKKHVWVSLNFESY